MSEYIPRWVRREKQDVKDAVDPNWKNNDVQDGSGITRPDFSKYRKPDKSKEDQTKETQDLYKKGNKLANDLRDHRGALKEWREKLDDYWRRFPTGTSGGAKNFAGVRPSLGKVAGGVFIDIISDPLPTSPGGLPPVGPPGDPKHPPEPGDIPLGPDQVPICGKGPLNPAFYNGGRGGGAVAQIRISKQTRPPGAPGTSKTLGIIKYYIHHSQVASFRQNHRGLLDLWLGNVTKNIQREGVDEHGPWVYTLTTRVLRFNINYTDHKWGFKHLIWGTQRFRNMPPDHRDPQGSTTEYSHHGAIDCIEPVPLAERPDPIKPGEYNREEDEEEMGCKWQKDEINYQLPKLKVGSKEIGGGNILIDDGLLPLADYLCRGLQMMHNGIGLDLLDAVELPTNVLEPTKNKVKHKSIAALTQWQFDNVSSLVGLPIKNTLTTIDDKTSDLEFRSVQDALSFMFHQQKESDTDLTVLEGYCTRIAQQLEAVTQICLRQHADIEMIIQELGFKYRTETKTRPSLYKIGMKDDDEKTGVIELFKGGTVSYPVRIWADEHDQRQIAMRTNLYAEISARSILQTKNTKSEIQGLDAMKKMNKNNKEDWNEYIKTINEPENGVLNGGTIPYIEEYVSGSVGTKKVPAPTSGLSLFMKPKTKGKK